MFDPELYRRKEEVEEWKHRDPIHLFRERLIADGMLSESEWARMEEEVAREVDAAVEFAEAGTWEPVEELERFVYSEVSGP
jgi:TPP-dependent pyruvate/acetoin dehydrogenase alpha subunit